jgi:Tfp pilus assembly protein PilZ
MRLPVSERRQAVRIVDHELKIMYDGLSEWTDARSPDLSPSGLFINTPHTFSTGAKLKLRFELHRTKITVQATGEVRYCLPGMGVGVEFVNLPEMYGTAIEKEMQEMEK